MDFNSILNATIYNKWFYAIIFAMCLLAYSFIKVIFGKIPYLHNKKNIMVVCLLGFLACGGFGIFSMGSMTSSASGLNIIDVQTTTSASSNGTATVSSTLLRTTDVRITDAQATGTGISDFNSTILTLTRAGDLTDASGVKVKCVVPSDYVNQSGTDTSGTVYHLIERDSLGYIECYLSNGAAATTSSQKGLTTSVFAAGSGTATLGVAFSIDESGHDAMLQYNSLPVQIVDSQTGEVLWTYNIFRM